MIDQSPLLTIKAKEDELAARIQAAREQAEAIVAQARAQAAAAREQAERDGLAKATAFRDAQLATARREAEVIEQTGHANAVRLRQRGESRAVHAAEFIVESILPPK